MYALLCALGLFCLGVVSATTTTLTAPNGVASWTYNGSYSSYATQYIAPGDTLTFVFTTGQHTVYQFPNPTAYTNCDFSSATNLSSAGPYNFSQTAGTYYLGCNVDSHCASGGMKVTVVVTSTTAAAPTFSPNGGPVTDGTVIAVNSSTASSIICITKDGTVPVCVASQTACSHGLLVDGNNNKKNSSDNGTMWQAIACATGVASSPVTVMTTALSGLTANPMFSPSGGAVPDGTVVNITSPTAGATICFTKNASVPACTADKSGCTGSSFKPDGTTNVKQTSDNTMMWSAIACLSGYMDSSIVNMSTALSTPMVANPVFYPNGGYVNDGTVITVNTTTTGATICITKNGTTPNCTTDKTGCATGSKPDGTFNVKASTDNSTKWMAIACWTGYLNSNVTTMATALATPAVSNPAFSPDGGTIADGTVVSVTDATSGATICITKGGTSPVCGSNKMSCTTGSQPDGTYNKKASSDNGMKWMAISCAVGMADSQVVTMTNTISAPSSVTQVATPTFSPNGGVLADGTLITVSTTTSGAIICLSRNGTTPSCNSAKTGCNTGTLVNGSVAKAASDNNVRWQAIGCASGMTDSSVATMGSAIQSVSHGDRLSVCFGTVLAAITVLSYWLI